MLFTPSLTRIITVLSICLAGIIFSVPNLLSPTNFERLPGWLKHSINLGLDLRGGSYIQLEVDLKAVNVEFLSNLIGDVRSNLRKNGIGYNNLRVDTKALTPTLTFNLRNLTQFENVKALILKIDNTLKVTNDDAGNISIYLDQNQLQLRSKKIIEQSIEVIRRRIDETGTKEPTILKQGDDRISVQLPGVDDPNEIKKKLGQTAKLTFHLVDTTGQASGFSSVDSQMLPYAARADGTNISVKKHAVLSGDTLVDAQASTRPDTGEVGVSLKFNNIGARKYADLSSENVGKQLAIVLDGKVLTAPVFREPILNGESFVSGGFSTIKDANELAVLLRAGSLPAPLKIVEERTIGPTLGADSIESGKHATIVAFLLVSIFMFAGYAVFGIFANVALAFNMILLFAGLSLLGATLTLPGIAGIAMTIGIAVDANVLIYERIKEEMRNGVQPMLAIEAGYARAMSTIVDANLTTLIAAAALYEFGSGPIRGFAVTTALGISVSMFTALSVTKLLTAWWFRKKQNLTKLPI